MKKIFKLIIISILLLNMTEAKFKVILWENESYLSYVTEEGKFIYDKIPQKISKFTPWNKLGWINASPNEKYLIYTDNKDENIILQNIETGIKQKVLKLKVYKGYNTPEVLQIFWSPDSKKVLITKYSENKDNAIHESWLAEYCLYSLEDNFKSEECISSPTHVDVPSGENEIKLQNDGSFIEKDPYKNRFYQGDIKTGEIKILDENKKIIGLFQDAYEENPKKSPFSDLPLSHPLYKKIIQAVEEGWISGYPDGTIKLEKKVNRAEFAKMLVLAFEGEKGKNFDLDSHLRGNDSELRDLESGLDFPILKKFSDIEKNAWYREFLAKAVEKEIMAGYPDLTMKPAKTINGAESLKMVREAFEKDSSQAQNDSKLSKNSESGLDLPWYSKYVTQLKNILGENIPQFIKEENFEYEITRADAISLIMDVENSKK